MDGPHEVPLHDDRSPGGVHASVPHMISRERPKYDVAFLLFNMKYGCEIQVGAEDEAHHRRCPDGAAAGPPASAGLYIYIYIYIHMYIHSRCILHKSVVLPRVVVKTALSPHSRHHASPALAIL